MNWRIEGLKDWRIEGLKDWRIEGLKDWRIEGLVKTNFNNWNYSQLEGVNPRLVYIAGRDNNIYNIYTICNTFLLRGVEYATIFFSGPGRQICNNFLLRGVKYATIFFSGASNMQQFSSQGRQICNNFLLSQLHLFLHRFRKKFPPLFCQMFWF